MNKDYDIGVLGWWYGENYGSMLTYYALNQTLKKMGYSVLMIHEALGYNGWRVHWEEDIAPLEFARRVGYDFTEQVHYSEMGKLNEVCRNFMVGSDQLWNPLIGRVNDDLFLDFVSDGNGRFAYGTSFGNRDTDKFSSDFIERHQKDLSKFNALSVREDYAVDIARDIFHVEAKQVVDPVFLLEQVDYVKLAEKSEFKLPEKYLLAFILDPNEGKRSAIEAAAKKLNFDKIVVLANPEDRGTSEKIFGGDTFTIVENNMPENWLNAYKNAGYVITDSFHGSCFAFIFERPFSAFYNLVRGADRFVNLMNLFGLGEQRRIYETDTLDDLNANSNVSLQIDFEQGKNNVSKRKTASLTWFEKVLSEAVPIVSLEDQVEALKKENEILKQTIAILSRDILK
ncbi:polysaccharide pyruvyl transferase family protein [Enterococcus sp. BWB1-3]|uniref:polysaccharide pyruvyl transferase family protein n=1 Tax=Enterococcus sp. BWB1-3 TaxID=2787713 RepID=UPI001922EEA9|nr:polysaccharide pyruvyl transferase family protein [Enterococcus sp. BWB1-3]MBL1230702.1 polysaccharide pyruvyl transferase family protein [Enterococcus sp. BWB1-3]